MLTDFPSKKNGPVALNPLAIFPTKNDQVLKVIFAQKRPSSFHSNDSIHSEHSTQKWLSSTKIDQTFGVQGDYVVDDIRRNFRRLNSSDLFNPVSPNNPASSLTELQTSRKYKKKFLLVEESALEELTKFENLLRHERSLLGEQCSLSLTDNFFEARIPLPAIRMAVQNTCEERMKRIRREITSLNADWNTFAKENHYNKSHLFLKNSYLSCAPVAQKALKLRLVREAAREWARRKDRDTMLFEDDMSYLTNQYLDALSRRRDYDRYFILAARYGPFSEQEFNLDAFPGRRYLKKANNGAKKLQDLWTRYWSVLKLRRFRSAKMIQKHIRRYLIYKKLHPIIVLRVKFGNRTYFSFFWKLWKDYVRIVKNIRIALFFRKYEWSIKCFDSWKIFLINQKEEKFEKRKRFAQKYGANRYVNLTFTRWANLTRNIKSFQKKVRCLISSPFFEKWQKFLEFRKHLKVVYSAVTKLQSSARMFIQKRIFRRKKRAQSMLRRFAFIIFSKHVAQSIREKVISDEFGPWRPQEEDRRKDTANEKEKERLNRRAAYVQQRERIAVAELRKHLKSPDGLIQLNDEVRLLPQISTLTLDKDSKLNLATEELVKRCITISRLLNNHDYDAKNPPFVVCADPQCAATITTEEQYHNHVANLPYHKEKGTEMDTEKSGKENCDHLYSHFHIMMRKKRGVDLVRTYLVNLHGLSGQVNTLDFWIAVQDWRKTPTARKDYLKKALQIFELFLSDDSPRRLPIIRNSSELTEIREVLQNLKHRESEGYFKVGFARRSVLRQLLGLPAQSYEQWTDRQVLNPTIFNDIEWKCFYSLYLAIQKDSSFLSSKEYAEYKVFCEEEKDRQTADLMEAFQQSRTDRFLAWAHDYKTKENAMIAKAEEAVMRFMKRETDKMMDEYGHSEMLLRSAQVSYEEQVAHEERKMILDDALSWAEENALEFVFDFYTRHLLEKMWSMPECQKGMLNYSGLLKTKLKKKLTVMVEMNGQRKGKDNGQEWLDEFLKQTSEMDRSSLPLNNSSSSSPSQAAAKIQRRVRGMLGRNKARKLFVKTFAKRMDPGSKSYFYVNQNTGTTSWTRPFILKRLFPNSTW